MHFILSIWLIAVIDMILAGPTPQNFDETAPDLNFFSSDGTDPLNIDSIDIALNPELSDDDWGSETNFNVNDYVSDPNDDFGLGSMVITTLPLDDSLTGSEINADDLDLIEIPSNAISHEEAFCGTGNGGVSGNFLRARDDNNSNGVCKYQDEGQTTTLPLELFDNAEAALRRLFEKKPSPAKEPPKLLPPGASSDDSNQCPPEFPTRCCTNELAEYYSFDDLRALYSIIPATCVPSTLKSL